MGRFGDLIAESNLDAIQTFERNNWAKLTKDLIYSDGCEQEDLQGLLGQRVIIYTPKYSQKVKVGLSRSEFNLNPFDENNQEDQWHSVYASAGPWAVKQYARPLIKEIVMQTMDQIKSVPKELDFSYTHILARILDLVHPTHQLQANILAYPLYSTHILKRRLLALGYEVGGPNEDLTFVLDNRLALEIMKQIDKRLEKDLRAYYEFIVSFRSRWRVGLVATTHYSAFSHELYAGRDNYGFGFDSDGLIVINGIEYEYCQELNDMPTTSMSKVLGILVDMHEGSIHLVHDSTILPPAFGKGAQAFSDEEQDRQRRLILKNQLIPMFGMKQFSPRPEEQAIMKINFGDRPFHHTVNAIPLNQFIQHMPTKGIDSCTILEGGNANAFREKMSQDEDEKLHTSLEKSYFKVSLLPDAVKSFSQFPPSVYRRSLAATRIQRGHLN